MFNTYFRSYPRLLAWIAIGILALSLLSPAVRRGQVMSGLECFAMGTLLALLSPTNEVLEWSLRVALVVNFLAVFLLSFSLGFFHSPAYRLIIWLSFFIAFCGVGYLFLVPFPEIEKVYFGYFLWLFGLLLSTFSSWLELTASWRMATPSLTENAGATRKPEAISDTSEV